MRNKFYTALLLSTVAIVLNMGRAGEAWADEGYCAIAPENHSYVNCFDEKGNVVVNHGSVGSNATVSADGKTVTGSNWSFTYAGNGTVTKTNSSNTESYTFNHDKYGTRTTTVNNKTGETTNHGVTYSTDSNGNTKVTQSNGTYNTYNSNDVRVGSGDNNNSYTYNENGTTTSRSYNSSCYYRVNNVCQSGGYSYTYDDNGKTTSYNSSCYKDNPDGSCQKGGYSNTYDSNGTKTGTIYTDLNGNQKVVANGQTTYLDAQGNPLTGTFTDGRYTYDYSDGTKTGSKYEYSSTCSYTNPNGTCQKGSYYNEYDADGKKVNSVYTDLNGNQKITANGQTTYLDAEGNALTGTYTEGRYQYNCEGGEKTGYTYGNNYYVEEYDANGRKVGYVSCNSRVQSGNSCTNVSYTSKYEYDENGRKIATMTEYSNGNRSNSVWEYDENGQLAFYLNCSATNCTYSDTGKDPFYYCSIDSASGSCLAVSDYGQDGVTSYSIDPNALSVVGKTVCNSDKTNCTTETYDEYGNVVAEYADYAPLRSYEYDYDDDTALVYDDQCRVKERVDANGNSLYEFGDSLNGTRRTQYTPAEAAEIVGNSQDNMIVMYFK